MSCGQLYFDLWYMCHIGTRGALGDMLQRDRLDGRAIGRQENVYGWSVAGLPPEA